MSDICIFVRNLPFEVDYFDLKDLFRPYNPTISNVSINPETRLSRGYGFIVVNSKEDQEKAIKEMNGKLLQGRQLMVLKASKEQEIKTLMTENNK